MVKPTSGICCEFAQKHGSEFVQNFFDKPLDIFVWRVYNDIVPGKTGAKKRRCNNATEMEEHHEQQYFYGAENTPCRN